MLARDDRRAPRLQPAHAENEEVHGVREERESHQNLEGARPQHEPDARARQHPDRDGEYELHQTVASPRSAPCSSGNGVTTRRGLRRDWCARATSISAVAPTTSM